MQAAGEQQEGQHAVHHRVVEVDTAQDIGDLVDQAGMGKDQIDRRQYDRCQHAHHQQTDIARQLEKARIDPAERRGQQQQEGEKIEQRVHAITSCFGTVACREHGLSTPATNRFSTILPVFGCASEAEPDSARGAHGTIATNAD